MSDEQTQGTFGWVSPCPHLEAVGERWGDPISEERQAELKSLADKQRERAEQPKAQRGYSYFMGKQLTGADVFWLAAYSMARHSVGNIEKAVATAQEQLHADRHEEFGGFVIVSRLSLEGAILAEAHLEGAVLSSAHLEGANLHLAHLEGAILDRAHLEGARFLMAHLEGADLSSAHLEGAQFLMAHLEGADLSSAHLERADFFLAHSEGAYLHSAHLEGASLMATHLEGVDLRLAHMDVGTTLFQAMLDSETLLADVVWNGIPLTRVDWEQVTILGDESVARDAIFKDGKMKDRAKRLSDYQSAVLAYRQVAIVLRSQGLTEPADRFAYRAQALQREVLRRQGEWLRLLGSWLLDLLAGYGYRPARSIAIYAQTIMWFAILYGWATNAMLPLSPLPSHVQPLQWYEALVLSVSSFHGRGFFQPLQTLGDPVAILAAMEAVFGLIIEVSFIATFTQRFFSRA